MPEREKLAPLGGWTRLNLVFDEGTARELAMEAHGEDPLGFPGYADKLAAQRAKTGLDEAAVAAEGRIGGERAVVCALDSRFMMGSMGTGVGERVTRAVEHAGAHRLPLIIFSASGGARMQEGVFSLLQMAKTSAAIARFQEAGGLFISVLTHPTTGGVTASFAMLGDIILAEPGATVGFAGRRVIEGTIGEKLPDEFQSAEFVLEHGFCDAIVPRSRMKQTLADLLSVHGCKAKRGE